MARAGEREREAERGGGEGEEEGVDRGGGGGGGRRGASAVSSILEGDETDTIQLLLKREMRYVIRTQKSHPQKKKSRKKKQTQFRCCWSGK